MSYPQPANDYQRDNEARFRNQVAQDNAQNHKRGGDIEVGKGCRVIFVDTVTGTRYAVAVTSGALALTAL